GRNFAAGMSGGIAYVYDEDGSFPQRCNTEMVGLENVPGEEEEELKMMLEKHLRHTGSKKAENLLRNWEESLARFVRVIPHDYKCMMEALNDAYRTGYTGEEAMMIAFEANNRSLSRLSGN
ncbi:MAG: hypothetical protein ACOX7P_06155, partial [Oscillospiraceae bacterium]